MNKVKAHRNYKDTVFRMLFKDKENLYASKQVMIPSPRFVVFYNGVDSQPERQTLKLSDAFSRGGRESSRLLHKCRYLIGISKKESSGGYHAEYI